ncbi:MAG TPA: amidase [Pirellulales bacterium]|nr:amidase [Pirellulales bacterium]
MSHTDLPSTILAAAQAIQSRRLTPLSLVENCLERIERFEPKIRAWVLIDEQAARETARRMGDEIAAGRYRGPLHGIPLGIKDIVDVAGWPTRAGSPLRSHHRADRDAVIVARLRAAGAVFLGKTVTTEFASFDPPPTRNPFNYERTPGGSSSGSAAAVATGMCLGAVGSQTGGSITRPASYCGVAGCKPTYGRAPLTGIVPLSFHLDHPGPIAKTVTDLALLLNCLAGYDASDPVSVERPAPDYAAAPDQPAVPRLGVLEDFFMTGAAPAVAEVTRSALERLRAAGAAVRAVSLPPEFADVLSLHRRVMAVEAADYHRATYREHAGQYGPNIAALIEEGLATSAIDYAAALVHQQRLRRAMLTCFADVDVLVTPATTDTAPGIKITGDPKFNSPWSYTGYPTISFPCGLADDGLPLSLQLIGRPWQEPQLFAAAAWCEQIAGQVFQPDGVAEP